MTRTWRATAVARVVSDSDRGSWEVTIRRFSPDSFGPDFPPRVEDVPADVRAALLAWLGAGRVLPAAGEATP